MMRSLLTAALILFTAAAFAQIAIKGETVYPVDGPPIKDGVVLLKDGKIEKIGPASEVSIPKSYKTYAGKVVTPGLVDAHSVVGLAGYLNQDHDQDQLESSKPIQPGLRAIDAYNAQEALVAWLRKHGVTTVHTGHGPGALISGQTMIVKTVGDTVDEATVKPLAMLAMTLGSAARGSNNKPPGTTPKMMAMLRKTFMDAQAYHKKVEAAEEGKEPPRDLDKEVLVKVLKGEVPIMVTAHRTHDILNAMRLADEFGLKLVIDGGAEAFLMTDRLKEAGIPVIIHPPMMRTFGDGENGTMEAAKLLSDAGVSVAFQSGFEGYVPKTRVVLFEAAIAAAYGLGMEGALKHATLEAAKIIGVDNRVGSLTAGKDGDVAVFNGDPFEYTSQVTHVFINGQLASDEAY